MAGATEKTALVGARHAAGPDSRTFTSTFTHHRCGDLARICVLCVLLSTSIIFMSIPSARELAVEAVDWMQAHTLPGAVFMTLTFIATSLLAFFPPVLLMLASGYCFPYPMAVGVSFTGSVLGAAAIFATCKGVFRSAVERSLVNRFATVKEIDTIVEKRGWQIVMLMRLQYFPYSIISYSLACTAISFLEYIKGTMIGITPAILVVTYVGSELSAMQAVLRGDRSHASGVFMCMGIGGVMALAVFVAVATYARTQVLQARQDAAAIAA